MNPTNTTQAPTPGPLSAQQEEAIAFNLCSLHGFDPAFVNTQRGFALAVIKEYERARPRLAPTAPVEASGSEREAVARLEERVARWTDRDYLGDERLEVDDALALADDILALLSARPLALDLVSPRPLDLGRVDDDASTLSTTPARAEARDEGAAGEFETAEAMAEAWSDRVEIQRMVETTSAVFAKWASPEPLSRFRQQMMAVIQQAYIEGVGGRIEALAPAHPSPPPAADADRVRIAVEALEAFIKAEDEARDRLREAGTPLPSTPEVDALREALAALKSTAAKEGGEA